jgi:hypothetical protein
MKFEKWFEEQFKAPLVNNEEHLKQIRLVNELKLKLSLEEFKLQEMEKLVMIEKVTLYAWNLSDELKK